MTRTASFVNLRRYQKAGGLQDRQHEGEAEEDSQRAHTRMCVCACVHARVFRMAKGKVPNCKRIRDLKKVAVI